MSFALMPRATEDLTCEALLMLSSLVNLNDSVSTGRMTQSHLSFKYLTS